jgi:hypothetical protein
MPFSVKTFTVLLTAITAVLAVPRPEPQLSGVLGELLGDIGPVLNLIPVLASPPPAFLWTKNPSPECANINQGALYCCGSTFNGDMPLVVELADAVNYKLNPNSINCIFGRFFNIIHCHLKMLMKILRSSTRRLRHL